MGTRGVIARKTEAGFEGRYHHWDSYPSGLGATLFSLYRGHFDRDLDRMLGFLLDEHTAWSTINDCDFREPPGYGSRTGPVCFCHGERSEEGWLVTHENASSSGCEYAYVFDDTTMLVLSSYLPDGRKMIGKFGMGAENADWHIIGVVDLDGEEPDWGNLPVPESMKIERADAPWSRVIN